MFVAADLLTGWAMFVAAKAESFVGRLTARVNSCPDTRLVVGHSKKLKASERYATPVVSKSYDMYSLI